MFDFTDSKNIGKEYKGFILLSIDDVKDYKTKAVYLRHKRTGLEVYHMLKDDKENLFAFAFRTLAKDSKGTAHIIEHSVLCGSEKYPIKEPYNTLASTSLSTYLNALTYPDKTVYPGASLVKDDYFNMMDVYADAVFFPKLDYATFIQEGHRLEMDEQGKLSIQGVVYNEMKGNYSSFPQVAFSELVNTMFPNSYPSFDSGGDPLEIPKLTYEEFCSYHQKFYSPENCMLFLYGNIPTWQQLDFLDERFMHRIEKKFNCTKDIANYASRLPLIKNEIKELQKLDLLQQSGEYKVDAPETGATGSLVCVSWYTGTNNMEKYYLSELLCGNDSTPLSKALRNSGLGDDICVGNFGQYKEEFFTAGLSGVKKGSEKKVYKLIEKTILDIYQQGFDKKSIEAAVMGIDFALREENRYNGPYSLQIMEKALKAWARGETCLSQLNPISNFEVVKEKIRTDSNYTKSLIAKYLVENDIAIRFVAEPSKMFFKERNRIEEELIKKLEQQVDKAALKKELDELHAYQQHLETPEEKNCIPSTKLSSLDANIDISHTELQFVKGADGCQVPLFVSKEETNGIFYLDVLFPFDTLAPEYYVHLPVLQNILGDMGWNGKKWDECIAESSSCMGDVWGAVYYGTVSEAPECQAFYEKYKDYDFVGRNWLALCCKALTSHASKTFETMAQMITTMSFDDKKRFESIVQEFNANVKGGFVSRGLDYISNRVCANWNTNLALCEILFGVTSLHTLNTYKKKKNADTLALLKNIYYECLNAGGIIHVTADEDSLKKLMPMIETFAIKAGITKLLPAKKHSLEQLMSYIVQNEAVNQTDMQFIQVDCQTGYAAAISPASLYMSRESIAEIVYAQWLNSQILWDKIRTSGGAYGARMNVSPVEQRAGFMTYRDPNPQRSIEVYLEILKEFSEKQIPKEDIEKTIVSCYGDVIIPSCPKDRGKNSFDGFIYAHPQELRQKRVELLLTITPEEVQQAARRLYALVQKRFQKAVFCNKKDTNYGKKIDIPL